MRKVSLLLIVLLALTGCATIGSWEFDHTNPTSGKYQVENEKYVDSNPEDVWNSLVKELAKTYFVINNIDKESRIINVSFSTQDPENYIDCGSSIVTTTIPSCDPDKGFHTYNYDTAESNSYKVGFTLKQGFHQYPSTAKFIRSTELEGRMNIYVAPKGSGTLVTVNCRYIFVSRVSQRYTNYSMACVPFASGTERGDGPWKCSFNSKTEGNCDWDGPLKCLSKGILEKEILVLIK